LEVYMCFNIDGLLRSNTTRLGRIRDQEEELHNFNQWHMKYV